MVSTEDGIGLRFRSLLAMLLLNSLMLFLEFTLNMLPARPWGIGGGGWTNFGWLRLGSTWLMYLSYGVKLMLLDLLLDRPADPSKIGEVGVVGEANPVLAVPSEVAVGLRTWYRDTVVAVEPAPEVLGLSGVLGLCSGGSMPSAVAFVERSWSM